MTAQQLEFAPWVKRFPAEGGPAAVVFPHAGGAAAAYRALAKTFSGKGIDTYIVQYPQRAERLRHPAAASIDELATQLFEAGPWDRLGPLDLFGHCMGAVVAFEFARVAERHGVAVRTLWASAGQAPSTVAEGAPCPAPTATCSPTWSTSAAPIRDCSRTMTSSSCSSWRCGPTTER